MKTSTFTLFALLLTAPMAWAGPPLWADISFENQSETNKLWAKAKAQAIRTDILQLRRQRVEALEEQFDARFKHFLAGQGSLDFLQEALVRLKEAEEALAETNADRLTAVEKLWLFQWKVYAINEARFNSGKIVHQDLMRSLYDLRDTELMLVEAWVRNGRQCATGLSFGAMIFEDERHSKILLQAKRRALNTPPRQLAEERLAAANEEWSDLYSEYVAGHLPLDTVFESEQRWAKAQLALLTDEADRTAVRERLWRQAFEIERLNLRRGESGRIDIQYYMASRVRRLTAQIDWRPAHSPIPNGGPTFRPGTPRTQGRWEETAKSLLVTPRDLQEVWATESSQLMKERTIAAELEVDARFKEFVAGRGTLDYLLRSSVRLVEAKEAVATTPQERLNARELHWQLTWVMERITQARFEAGKVAVQDLAASREYRLEAEIKWLELRKELERK
jgi:hypothetical protein